MKDQIEVLKKLLKDKTTTQVERDYINNKLLPWAIEWIKKGKPGTGPSTQDDPGDHPPPPPPHK